MNSQIMESGHGDVTIGGITHRIERQMLENFRSIHLSQWLEKLSKPVLLVHSPEDETLEYAHALRLYHFLTQRSNTSILPAPTTLVCLADADHLFTKNAADLTFMADVIAGWFNRQIQVP